MQAKRDSGLYYKWRNMPHGADFTTNDGNISSSWWERLIIVCPWCCRADEDLKWKAYWWMSLEDLQQKWHPMSALEPTEAALPPMRALRPPDITALEPQSSLHPPAITAAQPSQRAPPPPPRPVVAAAQPVPPPLSADAAAQPAAAALAIEISDDEETAPNPCNQLVPVPMPPGLPITDEGIAETAQWLGPDPEDGIVKLRKQVAELRAEVKTVRQENEVLVSENNWLRAENYQLHGSSPLPSPQNDSDGRRLLFF